MTLAGNIVISVGLVGHSGDDEIYVINVDGYMGSSTWGEIEYTNATVKRVIFGGRT